MWRAICRELKWPFIELYNNAMPPKQFDSDETDALGDWMEPYSEDDDGCWDGVTSDDEDQGVLTIAEDDE